MKGEKQRENEFFAIAIQI